MEKISTMDKLKILTDAAKYDVSCSSSGSSRKNTRDGLGNGAVAGICHSWSEDGRCISLLKVLFTNKCIYDCEYCINRRTEDVKRAEFSSRELADLTINFYKRNYIEGLFLSSAVIKNPDYTMELLIEVAKILRYEYKYNGYIHMKAIPGASEDLIRAMGLLVDRMSINIELAKKTDLALLAPEKNYDSIMDSMRDVNERKIQAKNEIAIYKHAPKFLPAGQTTQMIVGASGESDLDIITRSESLYKDFSLKRVYYSAFVPVVKSKLTEGIDRAPLLREHRLYQADWLLRFYGFKSKDLLNSSRPSFDLRIDPKTNWAIENIERFPLEINKATYKDLILVPGIGKVYAKRIIAARKFRKLDYLALKNLKISTKRAKNFILVDGKYYGRNFQSKSELKNIMALGDPKAYEQLSLF